MENTPHCRDVAAIRKLQRRAGHVLVKGRASSHSLLDLKLVLSGDSAGGLLAQGRPCRPTFSIPTPWIILKGGF